MRLARQIRQAINLPSLVGRIQRSKAIILWGLAWVVRLTTGVGVRPFNNILSVVTGESQPQVETL